MTLRELKRSLAKLPNTDNEGEEVHVELWISSYGGSPVNFVDMSGGGSFAIIGFDTVRQKHLDKMVRERIKKQVRG